MSSLLDSQKIDWNGNCLFDENGKIIAFAVESTKNTPNLKPIPKTEAILRDAKEADKLLQSIMQTPSRELMSIIITRLSVSCALQSQTKGAMIQKIENYFEDLRDIPICLIEKACSLYRKLPSGNEFMPTSGRLISLIQTDLNKLKKQRHRIDLILGRVQPPQPYIKKAQNAAKMANNLYEKYKPKEKI